MSAHPGWAKSHHRVQSHGMRRTPPWPDDNPHRHCQAPAPRRAGTDADRTNIAATGNFFAIIIIISPAWRVRPSKARPHRPFVARSMTARRLRVKMPLRHRQPGGATGPEFAGIVPMRPWQARGAASDPPKIAAAISIRPAASLRQRSRCPRDICWAARCAISRWRNSDALP